MDAYEFVKTWKGPKFDTVILDPPYNIRKAREKYNGRFIGKLKKLRKILPRILNDNAIIWWHYIFPNSEPIIIWKRSPGFSNKKKIIASYHVILTNIITNKNIVGLWHDLHPVADGFYWRLTKDYVSDNHPAQTSLEIVKRFIEKFSRPGERILDPFIGTGSTSQACIELNRFCFGFEINEPYKFDVIDRLKDCKKDSIQVNLSKFIEKSNQRT